MAASFQKKDRNVIPRWRPFAETLAMGELATAAKPNRAAIVGDPLEEKRLSWEKYQTSWHAADLVAAGVALRRESEVQDAAAFLSKATNIPSVARTLAGKVLAADRGGDIPLDSGTVQSLEELFEIIHLGRKSLTEDPRNAIVWVDLARCYTLLGMRDKASKAIAIATSLNSTNRFILRSAARFHIHQDEPDRAHRVITLAPNARLDPWLMSAEIALASVANRSPRLADAARKWLGRNPKIQPNSTELASALATLEHNNGKHRNAKKLFRDSLRAPNENSLAQAEWASERISGLDVRAQDYDVPRRFEATAWDSFNGAHWNQALENAEHWLQDQPFSSAPALLSSYVAACVFEDYKRSSKIIEQSLKPNPGHPILLNNLAYNHACQGHLDEAERVVAQIAVDALPKKDLIAVTATRGLILYRRGRLEEGRTHYLRALEIARGSKDLESQGAVMVFMAREEMSVGSPELGPLLKLAEDAVSKVRDSSVKFLLTQLKKARRSKRPA